MTSQFVSPPACNSQPNKPFNRKKVVGLFIKYYEIKSNWVRLKTYWMRYVLDASRTFSTCTFTCSYNDHGRKINKANTHFSIK